jgi:hypothetical protein
MPIPNSTFTRALTLLALLFIVACSPEQRAESSYEIGGTQAERIAAISSQLSKHAPLSSPLLDAHFVEDKKGDGQFGPSDFLAFYALTVVPVDLEKWRSTLPALEEQNRKPKYVSPKKPCSWWLTQDEFLGLMFYSPKSLTGRSHGWVGIAPDGRVYIFAFTM